MATAPLGRPAIATPNRLELRPVQQAIENIRERLKACDAAIMRVSAIADANTLQLQLNALNATVRQLNLRLTAVEAAAGADDVIVLPAGEEVQVFDPIVAISRTACGRADPSDPLRISAVIGVAQNNASVGQAVNIQRRGLMNIPGASFDVNRAVYAGIGGLTQMPSYGDFVIPIAMAVSSADIWIGPGWPALQDAGLYGSVFDDFLPVTWGLVRERLALLDALLDQPPGLVVFDGDALITREIQAGDGISVVNGDGVDGDPIISAVGDSVPTGSLTITGYAPTIVNSGSGNIIVQPGAGALVLAGLAPSIAGAFSPWDVSSLPANVTASEANYQLSKSAGGSSSRIVYHPITRSSGKYALRVRVRVPVGGAPSPAFGLIEVGESPGSYLGNSIDAVGYWGNSIGPAEVAYRNAASASIGNFGDLSTFVELMLEVDLDAGRVYAGGAGTWGGSADPAAGTGWQVSLDTGKTYALAADIYYDGDLRLLVPSEFSFPATSGFTAGWPD